jgi:hypothetical protein
MKKNILNLVENYKDNLDEDEIILFLKFVGMVHEMFILCNDRISVKNEDYIKHILITGIKNTTYIYKIILMYTNNLELTLFHTQKSILYYIEFISQIGEDIQNHLKLTTKDATLFIYKKTIFDINEEYKQTYQESPSTKETIKQLDIYINVYNTILIHYISHYDLKQYDLSRLQKSILNDLYTIVEAIVQIPTSNDNKCPLDNIKNKLSNIQTTITYFNQAYHYEFIKKKYLYLIEYYIKKLYKHNIDNKKIKHNLIINPRHDIELKIGDYSICKLFNYLTN